MINKISGQSDICSLSKYFNTEDYTAELETPEGKNINILHLNIRSIHKNFDALKAFLKSP